MTPPTLPQPWYNRGVLAQGIWSPLIFGKIIWVFGKIIWTFGSEQVRVTNFESMNKSRGTLQSFLLCGVGQILNVFLQKLSKLTTELFSISLNERSYVTVEVIKSRPKLIIVILTELKDFYLRVLVQNFLNALKSLDGSAAMLTIVFNH